MTTDINSANPATGADDDNDERSVWLAASVARLQEAYGEDEPDYPVSLILAANPEYTPE